VSEDNFKHVDWDYYKAKMQGWSYNDFRDNIPFEGMEVAEQNSARGIVALQRLHVGQVSVT
jgi:hypothetical protein